jgi:hypothetical protein
MRKAEHIIELKTNINNLRLNLWRSTISTKNRWQNDKAM